MTRPPRRSTLFPYTTLFRSIGHSPAQLGEGDPRPLAAGGVGRRVVGERDHCEGGAGRLRSEEHTSELQSQSNLVCRLLLEKKKKRRAPTINRRDTRSDSEAR